MHKLILATIIATCSFSAFAQSNNTDSVETKNPGIVLTAVEEMPEFPGGREGLMEYLSTNIRYPSSAKRKNVQGKVIVKFVVCQDGSLCNEEVVRPIGEGCDEEVIRVIKAMPKWKPGKQNGQPVKVYFTLPVSFKLKSDNPERTAESR